MAQFMLNGLGSAGINVLLALSFGLILRAGHSFHIAHGAVFMTAGTFAYECHVKWGFTLAVSFLCAASLGVALGVAIEWLIYAPLRNPRRPAFSSMPILISSLGVYVILVSGVALLTGNDTKVLFPGPGKVLEWGGNTVSCIQLWQAIAGLISVLAVGMFLKLTSMGLALRALADDPELLGTLGYDARGLRLFVFVLGSRFMAALGGALQTLDGGMDPTSGFDAVLLAIAATIIGGSSRFLHPAGGALLIALFKSTMAWATVARWGTAWVSALMLLFLWVHPLGLFGHPRRVERG